MEAESQIGCVQISTEKSNAPVDEMTLEDMDISNTKPHEEDFQLDITEQVRYKNFLCNTKILFSGKENAAAENANKHWCKAGKRVSHDKVKV